MRGCTFLHLTGPQKNENIHTLTNPGRVLCLQALYFPILQHRGTHTHPMPIRLYRGSTSQSLPVSFTAPSDVSAISELPRHHRDLGPRADCADPSALGSDRRDRLGAISRITEAREQVTRSMATVPEVHSTWQGNHENLQEPCGFAT